MTNIFDTHAHYSSRQFDADRDAVMRALVCVGIFLVNRAPQPKES